MRLFLTLIERLCRTILLNPANWNRQTKLALGGGALAVTMVLLAAVAPPAPATAKELLDAYYEQYGQRVVVADKAQHYPLVSREGYSAMPGIPQLAKHGTNYDWAKIVLIDGGWPVSDNNVTVITRWMRQENGADSWWNRNNPLNNGWGSGGGGGTGSYPTLVTAAEYAAVALHGLPGYAAIVAALESDAATDVTEMAIWASPWASGHYANGGHWHYTPVKEVAAPPGAWG